MNKYIPTRLIHIYYQSLCAEHIAIFILSLKYNYTYFPMVQDQQLFIQILVHSMYHSIHESNYVSLLVWIQQNIILWVAYMQQFISNSSRPRKSKTKALDLMSGGDPLSGS